MATRNTKEVDEPARLQICARMALTGLQLTFSAFVLRTRELFSIQMLGHSPVCHRSFYFRGKN